VPHKSLHSSGLSLGGVDLLGQTGNGNDHTRVAPALLPVLAFLTKDTSAQARVPVLLNLKIVAFRDDFGWGKGQTKTTECDILPFAACRAVPHKSLHSSGLSLGGVDLLGQVETGLIKLVWHRHSCRCLLCSRGTLRHGQDCLCPTNPTEGWIEESMIDSWVGVKSGEALEQYRFIQFSFPSEEEHITSASRSVS
jgi:hypothetical protein